MDTRIDEIEDRIYRISTYTAEGPPGGITFNQFLVDAEEPLLVHTGMRVHFADTLTAARRVVDPARLRWDHFRPRLSPRRVRRSVRMVRRSSCSAGRPRPDRLHGQPGRPERPAAQAAR